MRIDAAAARGTGAACPATSCSSSGAPPAPRPTWPTTPGATRPAGRLRGLPRRRGPRGRGRGRAQRARRAGARRRLSPSRHRGNHGAHRSCVREWRDRADGRSTEPAMSVNELKIPPGQVPDTRELVIRRAGDLGAGARRVARRARGRRRGVPRVARAARRRVAYAAYRAAQDREDAAQDALASRRAEPCSRGPARRRQRRDRRLDLRAQVLVVGRQRELLAEASRAARRS